MKLDRTKNSIINILSGIFNKIANMILPFVIRTVIIYVLGVEYLGLNTLFISILQILNLAELGLSSAIVFSMYKPIAENDTELVCALLRLYRKIYYIIGIVVLCIGLLLMPFLKFLINGSIPPDVNLYILYAIYLLNTVISYFFFAYKSAIWNASQHVSTVNNIASLVLLVQSIIQVILLLILKNYYFYIAVMPICTILNNIMLSFLTKKYFPNYVCKGNVSKELSDSIKLRVKGLFITKLCTTTRNSLDSIFISSMIGLTAVAIYGNYYYVMSAVFSITNIVISSISASIGNSIVTESIEKNYADLRKFNFAFAWISGVCTICMLCLYQPFMRIWMGEENMYPFNMVILFCLYFYSLSIGSVRAAYHDAAGLWWEARYRALLETIMNVALNFLLTYLIGVAGTVISTILSILVINYGYGTQIVFKHYFKGISSKQYYIDNVIYFFACVVAATITFISCYFIPLTGILEILVKLVICCILPNLIFLLLFFKSKLFKENLAFVKVILHRRRGLK